VNRGEEATVQRRVLIVLVIGQVLGGLGTGAALAVGSILAARIGGPAWSGAGATLSTLGAALAAVPLSRIVLRAGRRPALVTGMLVSATGAAVVVVAVGADLLPLLLVGYAMLGFAVAVNLQSRFAATDLAEPRTRGRDLSIAVWSTTVGTVVGPNLIGPGEELADAIALPTGTGTFLIAVVAQLCAAAVYLTALRPDPYLTSRRIAAEAPAPVELVAPRRSVIAVVAILALSHAVMVAMMAMTPVHLVDHGAALTFVGFSLSLHIAGMYGLSPLFGWLSDRIGAARIVLVGQAVLLAALVVLGLGAERTSSVTTGLVMLGVGWSAATIGASALLADLVRGPGRTVIQGRSDLAMSLTGAAGGAVAGPVLAVAGYAGLAFITCAAVAAVVALTLPMAGGGGMRGAAAADG
jgi:MFS family permease